MRSKDLQAGFGLAALVFIGATSCGSEPASPSFHPPATVGPLACSRLLRGDQARRTIDQLLPVEVRPESAWVAEYGAGLTVYASCFRNHDGAPIASRQYVARQSSNCRLEYHGSCGVRS